MSRCLPDNINWNWVGSSQASVIQLAKNQFKFFVIWNMKSQLDYWLKVSQIKPLNAEVCEIGLLTTIRVQVLPLDAGKIKDYFRL